MIRLIITLAVGSALGMAHAQLADPQVEKIVATRGTAVTTIGSLDVMLAKAPSSDRAGVVSARPRIQQLVEASLLSQQLAAKARELKLDQDPFVQRRMKQAQDDVLSDIAMEHLLRNLEVKNFEPLAKEYYLANLAEFGVPDGFKVQHILISKEGRTEEQVKSIAAEVFTKAQQPGVNFEQLVNDYSDDPSKSQNNGVLVVDKPNVYLEAFESAARKFRTPGEFAPLTNTSYGTHIIRFIGPTKARTESFEDAREKLLQTYEANYIDESRRKIISDFRAEKPVVNEEVLDELFPRYVRLHNEYVEREKARKAAALKALEAKSK